MPDNPLAPGPIWREPEFARGARDMTGTALGIAGAGLIGALLGPRLLRW